MLKMLIMRPVYPHAQSAEVTRLIAEVARLSGEMVRGGCALCLCLCASASHRNTAGGGPGPDPRPRRQGRGEIQ